MMEIRGARTDEIETVRALLRECQLPTDGVPDELESLFVATVDGRIVGVAALERHGRDGLIRSVAVSPESRGRNLASRLCAEVERYADLIGAQRIFLLTETAESLFLKRGYRTGARGAGGSPPPSRRRESSPPFARVPQYSGCVRARMTVRSSKPLQPTRPTGP